MVVVVVSVQSPIYTSMYIYNQFNVELNVDSPDVEFLLFGQFLSPISILHQHTSNVQLNATSGGL